MEANFDRAHARRLRTRITIHCAACGFCDDREPTAMPLGDARTIDTHRSVRYRTTPRRTFAGSSGPMPGLVNHGPCRHSSLLFGGGCDNNCLCRRPPFSGALGGSNRRSSDIQFRRAPGAVAPQLCKIKGRTPTIASRCAKRGGGLGKEGRR